MATHAIVEAWSLRSWRCRGGAPSGPLTSEGAHRCGCWPRCYCWLRLWRAKERSIAVISKRLPFKLNVLRGALVPARQGLSVEAGWIEGSGHGISTRDNPHALSKGAGDVS